MISLRSSAAAAAPLLLAIAVAISVGSATAESLTQSEAAWHKLSSNVNYRITAILDVNGGADAGPTFESFAADREGGEHLSEARGGVSVSSGVRSCIQRLFWGGNGGGQHDDSLLERIQACLAGNSNGNNTGEDADSATSAKTTAEKSRGYSIPIEVLTLQDPATKAYHQRISYYSGTQVDYNVDGVGYKVVPTPYTGERATADDAKKTRTCLATGGSETEGDKKIGYLNFFPNEAQMEQYTLGKLITSEPGVPYRIATLEAPHGSYNATPSADQPDASYDAHPGMPTNDWFQFHYEESLSGGGGGANANEVARPIQWTMLARNQIINAHTENWVLRYVSYEAMDADDEHKLWKDWFDAKFKGDCGQEPDTSTLAGAEDGHNIMLKLNRLGMFFSTASAIHPHESGTEESPTATNPPSEFDLFLARHNRHYPSHEYATRKSIHDANARNIERWNEEHAGKTTFASNEFLDLTGKEVMQFRGGHVPPRTMNMAEEDGGDNVKRAGNLRQGKAEGEWDDRDILLGNGSNEDEYTVAPYEVPAGFDPSTLPESFDWRDHLPGSVGAIKDQGFCGSCWAFSFIAALESHWFITHGQSVILPEQFVNDCAWSDAVHACDGGDAGEGAKSLISKFQGKVPTREAYGGYLSVDGACYLDILQDVGVMDEKEHNQLSAISAPSSPSTVQLTDWVTFLKRDDIATKHALFTKGPLSVALNVVDEAIYYSNGVLDVESCLKNGKENLDHAVNLVGWGVDELPDGTKAEHWILRNSWSSLWGDSGYFKVRMGERDCGITTDPGFPVVQEDIKSYGKTDLVDKSDISLAI